MAPNKTFQIALAVSVIIHATIFFNLPYIQSLFPHRVNKQVEVSYVKEEAKPLPSDYYKQNFSKKPTRQTFSKKLAPPPFVEKEKFFNSTKNVPIKKPKLIQPEITAFKKKITLPPLSAEQKISNPTYMSYYQIIREKIRRAAYRNYGRFVNGEVCLAFVILNDGGLMDVKVNKDSSSSYKYLQEIALQSVYDAAPFPSFPKELDYPELSFNVIISFEIE